MGPSHKPKTLDIHGSIQNRARMWREDIRILAANAGETPDEAPAHIFEMRWLCTATSLWGNSANEQACASAICSPASVSVKSRSHVGNKLSQIRDTICTDCSALAAWKPRVAGMSCFLPDNTAILIFRAYICLVFRGYRTVYCSLY